MFDIKWIRENAEAFDEGMKRRGLKPQAASLIAIDLEHRELVTKLQEAQTRRNAASKEIGKAMSSGDSDTAEKLKAEVSKLKDEMANLDLSASLRGHHLDRILQTLPNLPLDDVPVGADEEANTLYHEHGTKPALPFKPKEHFDIGEALGLMNFEVAAKLAGARFTVLKGDLARLERALGQLMMDVHVSEHGYTEVSPPLLVNDASMLGTGQLPKFMGDLFVVGSEMTLEEKLDQFDFLSSRHDHESDEPERVRGVISALTMFDAYDRKWLIPTAEVPLTNMVAGEIVAEKDLPMRMTALTPCFRSEAGSAGRDTRGMLRQHQFWKTELVSITTPEESLDELQRMLGCAESVLKKLGLHYRVMTLSSGDMGFGARKTYDIEVWLPGQNAYREISSCSVCGDFQARRMNARYRLADGKTLAHVHTLNGSGVAVGRALIAVLENCQNEDGSVTIPEVLVPYMGGKTKIGKAG